MFVNPIAKLTNLLLPVVKKNIIKQTETIILTTFNKMGKYLKSYLHTVHTSLVALAKFGIYSQSYCIVDTDH